jgi:hypothetical protein
MMKLHQLSLVCTIILANISPGFSQDSTAYDNVTDTITIIGVGDIMLGTNFPNAGYLPPNDDFISLMQALFDTLKEADITFGNLEGGFMDDGPVVKKCRDTTKCYAFRTPVKYAACLDSAGFDFMSLANNHAADFGKAGLDTTQKILNKMGIGSAGLKRDPVCTIDRGGIKIGLCAFSPNKGTCDINDLTTARSIVESLEAQVDIVVLSMHAGAEGADYQHVTKARESFYGENRGDVYHFAREMIDAGADVIFGHGPHVTRAIDFYKGRFIIYSMGNFCTYGRFNLRGPNGIAPIVKLWLAKDGELIKARIIPVFQDEELGVRYDMAGRVIQRINYLTRQDIPELDFSIDEQGWILFQ